MAYSRAIILNIGVVILLLLAVGLITFFVFMYSLQEQQKTTGTPNFKNILDSSWLYYKSNYVQADGRVIDQQQPPYESTSEGESYALLRAVYENDRKSFETIKGWIYANLGARPDGLFAWEWGKRDDNTWGILNAQGGNNSATDGDEQVALALIGAYQKWHDTDSLAKAKALIHNIYMSDTATADGHKYIVGGNWANDSNPGSSTILYVNPSYLQLGDYRLFAAYDHEDDWNDIINSSYMILDTCSFNTNNIASLPTNWCVVRKGDFSVDYGQGAFQPVYGFDAFRTLYYLSIDYALYQDPRDIRYITKASQFLEGAYKKGDMHLTYDVTSGQGTSNSATALDAGPIAAFSFVNSALSKKIFDEDVLSKYAPNSGQFGDAYYDENWNWFSMYFMQGTFVSYLF